MLTVVSCTYAVDCVVQKKALQKTKPVLQKAIQDLYYKIALPSGSEHNGRRRPRLLVGAEHAARRRRGDEHTPGLRPLGDEDGRRPAACHARSAVLPERSARERLQPHLPVTAAAAGLGRGGGRQGGGAALLRCRASGFLLHEAFPVPKRASLPLVLQPHVAFQGIYFLHPINTVHFENFRHITNSIK